LTRYELCKSIYEIAHLQGIRKDIYQNFVYDTHVIKCYSHLQIIILLKVMVWRLVALE